MSRIKKPTAIDLFAGIGGIRLGLEKAGFNVIFSNDIDEYCKVTFDHNHQEKLVLKDIKEVSSIDIPQHDLLAAGFPCQPFSMAGHKKGFDDERGSLFFEICRVLKDKQPKAFLLENVQHLERHDKGATFAKMKDILVNELGYKVFHRILNSKDFGLPQNRPRIYIVGFKDDVDFTFPEPLVNEPAQVGSLLETKEIDDWYYLSQRYYEGLIRHKNRHQAKGHGFGFNILDLKGISYALVVGNMGRERNLIKGIAKPWFYKEGMDKSETKNSDGVRKLTIREYARLQGFPDNFEFPVTKTQSYKQIGNSVAIPVVEAVAKSIMNALRSKEATSKTELKEQKNRIQDLLVSYIPSPI